MDEDLTVPRGQLTFDAEGNDDTKSASFSHRPRVLSATSGLTIGRGYDLKKRSAEQAEKDLTAASARDTRQEDRQRAGLKGDATKKYVKDNLAGVEITRPQQKDLFARSYAEAEADVKRISDKQDVVENCEAGIKLLYYGCRPSDDFVDEQGHPIGPCHHLVITCGGLAYHEHDRWSCCIGTATQIPKLVIE